jgi:hypothetical protein
MTGQNPDGSSVIPQVKAFENTIFGPRTLGRTWGFAMTQTRSGLIAIYPDSCFVFGKCCPSRPVEKN